MTKANLTEGAAAAHSRLMRHLQFASWMAAVLLAAAPAVAQKPPPLGSPGPGLPAPSAKRAYNGGPGDPLPGKPPPLNSQDGSRDEAGKAFDDRLPPDRESPSRSGTGFVVADGKVMTNNHVVDECRRMVIRNASGTRFPARVDATDRRRDLALMTVSAAAGPPLTFRDNPPVQRGENVVTYGFPLSGLVSSGPTLTTGDVSALTGLRDNPMHIQISAPVQQGNSGGPLLDAQGNVIGVVVSKLSAARVAAVTGDIPQNVNFAIKGTEALAFLRANGVRPHAVASEGPDKRNFEIGLIANPSTVYVLCYE